MKKTIQSWLNYLLIAGFVMILTTSCTKSDSTTDPTQTTNGTVKDIDGNSYTTVTIGTQVWMVENLKTTKYRNGDPINNVITDEQWSNITSGAYCNYDNGPLNSSNGRLYNWYAMRDSRKIAPIGWHIPSTEEWKVMINYLGGDSIAGDKILEKGAANWGEDNTSDNSSGFTALPAGSRVTDALRDADVQFYEIGEIAVWWSSTESSWSNEKGVGIYAYSPSIEIHDYLYKNCGLSIRCIKD